MSKGNHTSVSFDRATSSFVGLTPVIMSQLYTLYPGVSVDKELLKMSNWMLGKGKSTKGTLVFIMNWLSRVQPNPAAQPDTEESPLGHLLNDYLEDLWKNSQHIHQFNKIHTS